AASTWRSAGWLVQVQVCLPANEGEDLAHLLEAGAKEEIRIPAIAFRSEDVEVRLRVAEDVRALGGHLQAVRAGVFEHCGRQVNRPEGGVTLVDLKLPV